MDFKGRWSFIILSHLNRLVFLTGLCSIIRFFVIDIQGKFAPVVDAVHKKYPTK